VPNNLFQLNSLLKDDLFLKQRPLKVWLRYLLITFCLALVATPFFFLHRLPTRSFFIIPAGESPNPEKEPPTDPAGQSVNDSNVLILGIPGGGNDAPDLTDTILLASLHNQFIDLFSIPRDLAVKTPDGSHYTKINALYAADKSAASLRQRAEEISGLNINHYFIIDLAVVKELVDKTGGLNMLVEQDIYDDQYPDNSHGYQLFEIKKGWRYLDGETALKYIRSRHSTSDFDRIARQQQVIAALKNKLSAMSLAHDFNKVVDVYYALSSHIKTDLNILELWQLWKVVKDTPNEQISRNAVDENLLIADNIYLGGRISSILKPKAGLDNYSEIKNYIQAIINKNTD